MRSSLIPQMLPCDRGVANQTGSAGPGNGPFDGRPLVAVPNLKPHQLCGGVRNGTYPGLLTLLLAQPEAADERHRRTAGGVRAGNGPSPEPRDDGCLFPVRKSGARVQVPDAALGFIAHPLAVVADVIRKHAARSACSGRTGPAEMQSAWVAVSNAFFACRFLVDDVEWEGNFDELGGHQASTGGVARCQSGCPARLLLEEARGGAAGGW